MKKMTVKTKFQIGAGVILLAYCTIAAAMGYYHLKGLLIEDMIIYNTTTNQFNFHENDDWVTK